MGDDRVVGESASPTVGNFCEIIPSAMQASLLRNRLSDSFVMYVICRVSRVLPEVDLPEKRRMVAPMILIPLLLAAYIRIVTGMRSFSRRPKRWMIFIPPKQL